MTQTIATYSLPPSQRYYLIIIGGVAALSQLLDDDPVFALAFIILFGLVFILQGRWRTEIGAEGVEMLGHIRGDKMVRWDELAKVDEHGLLGMRSIRLIRADGSKLQLPAPIDGWMAPDPDYEAKVATIRAEAERRGRGTSPETSAPDGTTGVDFQ